MRGFGLVAVVIALAGLALSGTPAAPAETATAYCRRVGTSDATRPLPAALVPAASRMFGLGAMPAAQIRRSTLYRCRDRRVVLCNLGANLPCGKADTRRDPPAVAHYCAAHAGADFIPMVVTGHDTIYRWRCDGTRPATVGAPLATDRRGFIAQYWKTLPR